MNSQFDFNFILRRKSQILFAGFLGACLSVAASRVLPHQYAANGGMIVENSEPNVPELGMGIGTSQTNNDGVVITQVEVLRSRGLVERVVRDYHLSDDPNLVPKWQLPPWIAQILGTVGTELQRVKAMLSDPAKDTPERTEEEKVIDYVQKNLKIQASEHSSVVSVRFQAGSSEDATNVLNAVMATYLSNDIARRRAQITAVNRWLSQRSGELEQSAAAAEVAIQDFVKTHNQPEVQGSLTSALLLSKDQDQLAVARQTLANQQAILEAAQRSGGVGAQEVLDSKTIEAFREREQLIAQQLAALSPNDPRRLPLQQQMGSLHAQINVEIGKIVGAIEHKVEVAQKVVASAQANVDHDLYQSNLSSVAAATLTALRHDAEAKRQMYVAFGTRTERTMLAAAELPSARILFDAAPEPPRAFIIVASMFGFMGGALAWSAYLVLRGSFNAKISTATQMTIATGLPMLGTLPRVQKAPLLLEAPATSMIGETLRSVWLRLRPLSRQGEGITVLVTSSDVGEGKTTVAAALAGRIAADGHRVLLVDADLRRHRLGAALGSISQRRSEQCLENVLGGILPLRLAIAKDSRSGVDCLLSNGGIVNPALLLSSAAFDEMLAEAKQDYDFIILDSPPVLRVTDTVLIAQRCQHILFIVRADYLAGSLISEATRRFYEADYKKIMTLMTGVHPSDLDRADLFSGY